MRRKQWWAHCVDRNGGGWGATMTSGAKYENRMRKDFEKHARDELEGVR